MRLGRKAGGFYICEMVFVWDSSVIRLIEEEATVIAHHGLRMSRVSTVTGENVEEFFLDHAHSTIISTIRTAAAD